MPFSWLDIIVVAMMLISGFLAMLRGLTREVLSILSWALAAVATLLIFPMYQDVAAQYIQPPILAKIVLAAGVFVIVLVIVSFITIRISDRVLDSDVGALDRSLGFVFGMVRGLLLVVIAYLFFKWLVPPDSQPQWIREARTQPILEQAGDMILSLLPENPTEFLPGGIPKPGEGGTDPEQRSDLGAPKPGQAEARYSTEDRSRIDQVLETTRAGTN